MRNSAITPLHLYDLGLHVVVGELDRAETFDRVRAAQASLVVMTAADATNTNVIFTLREVAAVSVVATATHPMAGQMLTLAGCSHVLYLGNMMGAALARRVDNGSGMPHVIGRFEQLLIAEAPAAHTPLAGTTLKESRLRECVDISVVRVWERGRFDVAGPETSISRGTVLVLAGTPAQLRQYHAWVGARDHVSAPVLILGGGAGRGDDCIGLGKAKDCPLYC